MLVGSSLSRWYAGRPKKRRLTLEVRSLRSALADRQGIEASLLGRSPQIQEVRQAGIAHWPRPMSTPRSMEKPEPARMSSRAVSTITAARRGGNYVPVNCGGLPESLVESELLGHESGAFTGATRQRIGKIEYANGGTLFSR